MMRIMVSAAITRARGGAVYAPRKRITASLVILLLVIIGIIIIFKCTVHLSREDQMEERIVEIHSHLQFLQSQYRGKQEDVMSLQVNLGAKLKNYKELKSKISTKSASGINPKPAQKLKTSFVFQILPHLMNDPNSLIPVYHMKSSRLFADVVIGIPTVKRDKENYLMTTLQHLITGLNAADRNSTLIVIMIGEIDLNYVLATAREIEMKFPEEIEEGLIEIVSPSASYYPDLEAVPITLGDSPKRMKWRTKQNLDTIYLMAHCQARGTMYLMLEDDVIAKDGYMQDIKKFTAETSVRDPHWFFIEFCHVGGIGKLFKSPDLLHFLIYVQLFYTNMPIDWLLESYLANRVCTIDKTSKQCGESKFKIRPKYKTSLFQHIGLYSSLKGKLQKVKNTRDGIVPTYFPYNNPPVKKIVSSITEHAGYTLKKAYEGKSFFWGVKPKKGNVIEFWFTQPTTIARFSLRSGNADHITDKFYNTYIEVLPYFSFGNFTIVGRFDEFGVAEGNIRLSVGPLSAIRLRVYMDSRFWVILSEIQFQSWTTSNISEKTKNPFGVKLGEYRRPTTSTTQKSYLECLFKTNDPSRMKC